MEQYLHTYINYRQHDWCGYLPLAEFAYNTGYQETIKNTPFFANYGINPEYEMIGHLIPGEHIRPEERTQLHESLRDERGLFNYDTKNTRIYTGNPIRTYSQEIWSGCCHATSRPKDE